MTIILHITSRREWEAACITGTYRGDTLDTEGFIHCSEPHQVSAVANALFRGQAGLVLLCIAPRLLTADLRYEAPPGAEPGERFPHLYGPLNREAVIAVLDFPPGPDGLFVLPPEVADLS